MFAKIRLLSVFFIILFLALTARLFWWQVINGRTLADQARNQHTTSTLTSAPRGNILASDGTPWVARMNAWDIWANPRILNYSPLEVARKLSPLLAEDYLTGNDAVKEAVLAEEQRLLPLLKKDASWVILKQKVYDAAKKNIEALDIEGIGYDAVEASYYPEASSAAQILGFVGKDSDGLDIGYFGLEGYYNLPLSGKPGYLGGERDAKGSPLLLNGSTQVSAVSGVDLLTSIDKRVQSIIEEELEKGIEKYGATGGSVTVMDPKTGKILAMANLPSFDPSAYSSYSNSLFKNPIITDTFEPGSILKVVVMAAGLDAGVVRPDTECDICSGPLKLDKYFIKTWNEKYTANITMTDVIVESDNVGMSFVGQKLGADQLYDYLTKFGVGQKTGIDLQGEVAPKLREKGTWNVVDLATTSFGQGVAVTGIEMVRAVAVIANGGYLVTPRVVDSVVGDGWEEKAVSNEPVRIISEKAASEMTQMMVEAAGRGEAKWVAVPGYSVAGKTGTAQIPVAGHYDEKNTNHSFVGFASPKNPKFVMLVTLKSPQTSPWAAETAAPVWFAIAEDLFPYFGIAPDK
ncbi:hypothetical protein A2594_02040 [Candidatus Woesebacteria bacterium RIFOXYD1_FULL_41_28]|uniref:Penicillin-binding protein transpeptidase domain-containing protein n=1 Tax=Candidatus Woesebacteria bacterium RIFOXYD1_FULL_41_28 TaxID=1802550 RepID=A0A1F8DIR8_9BACT|nr:MAG: hypothetical protein A2594_02040 [Candidatus Woesebacteria bacterium RIFOXYD1_FULL_41_28]